MKLIVKQEYIPFTILLTEVAFLAVVVGGIIVLR